MNRRPSVALLALALALTGVVTTALPSPVWALTPEEEATATRLMKEGIAARDRGDVEAAEKSFRAAHKLADLPSSGHALAQILERRGRLVEALAIARAVSRMPPQSSWTSASTDGFRQCASMVPALEKRVASVTLSMPGVDEAAARFELDGEPLKPPVLGVARQIDPGKHRIVVQPTGAASAERSFEVREGQALALTLDAPAAGPASPPAAPPPDDGADEDGEIRPLRVVGVVAMGVGIAAVGAGVVPAVMSQNEESELEPSCPGGTCPPAKSEELSAAEDKALLANILFIGGGVVAATGLTLFLVDVLGEEDAEESASAVHLRAGPTWVGVDGRF